MVGEKRPASVKASDLEDGISLEAEKWVDRRKRRKIQKRELSRILTFFISTNISAGILIILMAMIEHFHPTPHPIITDKVIIAAIGGITIQSGAIILAAFKGLFSEK